MILNNVVTYLSKCGTLILLITIQKEQRLNFVSNGQQVPFFEYSVYLMHDTLVWPSKLLKNVTAPSEGKEKVKPNFKISLQA